MMAGASGNLVRIIAWYDNETAYATRLVELAAYLSGHPMAHLDPCRQQARRGLMRLKTELTTLSTELLFQGACRRSTR